MRIKLERYFIVLSVLGIVLGQSREGSKFFRGISFNYLAFLSLFGGIMVLGCLTPAMIDFFNRDKRERLKIIIWVCSLSSILLVIPMTGFLRNRIIELGGFGEIYFKLKIYPLVNFTTAVALSAILGFIASKRRHLERGIREFGRGIEELIKIFILPGFMVATLGILSIFNLGELLEGLGIGYLKNIAIFFAGLLILFIFFKGRIQMGWARGIYKILFVGTLIAPILIKNVPSMGIIFIYILIVSFSTVLNPKLPPMVALGLFAEMAEITASALGSIIVLYFVCSGIERRFCNGFKSKLD